MPDIKEIMITDWKKEIAVAWLVKQAMMELDKSKIYSCHLPEVAATEVQIQSAEDHLGFGIDSRYRLFLQHANGWKSFLQSTDLFGTQDLRGSAVFENAELGLGLLDEGVLQGTRFRRKELLPIAASMSDRDLCVMTRPESANPGMVFWFGGGKKWSAFPILTNIF